MKNNRVIRKRFFLAVEGEGEQSFIKWLQQICDEKEVFVHLDCKPLGGCGYQPMLKKAVSYRCRKQKYKSSILLIDSDRGKRGEDGWSIARLTQEAKKQKFNVCLQNPNQEGLFLRMMPDKENFQPNACDAHKQLLKEWPDYKKPAKAETLAKKFSLDNLLRVAKKDSEIKQLLSIIGLF